MTSNNDQITENGAVELDESALEGVAGAGKSVLSTAWKIEEGINAKPIAAAAANAPDAMARPELSQATQKLFPKVE